MTNRRMTNRRQNYTGREKRMRIVTPLLLSLWALSVVLILAVFRG